MKVTVRELVEKVIPLEEELCYCPPPDMGPAEHPAAPGMRSAPGIVQAPWPTFLLQIATAATSDMSRACSTLPSELVNPLDPQHVACRAAVQVCRPEIDGDGT